MVTLHRLKLVRTIQHLTCNLLFAVICRTCGGSLDQDAKPHELPLTGSTFKSVPRQSRVRREEVCDTHESLGSLVSARSISSQEKNVSIYLPEGELERKHLATLNNALTSISEGSVQPFLRYIDYDWNETSEKTKRQYVKKVEEAITLVLRTVAPSQEEPLWQSVIKYHLSHERPKSTLVLDAGVEAIVAAYNESENRSTRIEILSLICEKYSQTELQELIPDISRRQIQNARQHVREKGAGETKVPEKLFRCRLDMDKVREFILFISRSTFLQDVAFGTKKLKLNSGVTLPILAVVRTMTATKIVHLYQQECKQEGKEPLNERTCFRIMQVCSASKQKSLQGLDNTSTAGIEAFETLETLVATNGAGATWGRETAQRLRAGTKYLKCDYKCNLGPDEHCPDHCIQFTLSDPGQDQFCSPCNHEHDLVCLQCQSIRQILNSIKEKVENKDISLTEEQRERARWEWEHAVTEIEAWKSHLLRTFQQDITRQDALNALNSETILAINDWAMKLLPMKYRETQSEWFGKRGMNWHFSAVGHSSDQPDCQPKQCEYQIHSYIAVFDSCKQDWFSVSCILEEVLSTVKETHPSVKRAIIRSDNAGCYHNSALLSTINSTSKRTGIEVVRYDFSDPQAGKDLCDRRIAPCKQRLRNYVTENNDIQTAQDVKNALGSPPSITGTRVAVCTVDLSQMSANVASNKIPNITKYNNFSFEKDIITVWQAYGIGAGQKIYTLFKLYVYTRYFRAEESK